MDIKILKSGYKLATGPKGNVYLHVIRKPHLIYELSAAKLLGLISIAARPPIRSSPHGRASTEIRR